MRETIKKFSGEIVGYYEIDSSGNKTVTDFLGRILGYYEKSRNVTMLFNRTVIAKGDVTGIFFRDSIRF
ncbi:MAG: hypothetical protein J5622_03755 [Firmicutes bacterium]|nr:hypothetical protein [Clostridia bacterium]MBO4725602.1 hypothetical protein [Bacillota bacterium]MCR5056180.1 hypothetical protein [Clostridia bacterium]